MDIMMECERIELRPLSLKEMEQIQAGEQSFLETSVLSDVIKTAIDYKIERLRLVPAEAALWMTYWLIREKTSGKGIGLVGSKYLPDKNGMVEIGYAIAAEWRNHGYMREALDGFLDWLYEYDFCNGARLSIRSSNVPSLKVADNCGFVWKKTEDIYEIYEYMFDMEEES